MSVHTAFAQNKDNTFSVSGPLQTGDTIPSALWQLPLQVVNHPENRSSVTLNDYRGKLIILDFWATWCSSCISNMSRLHTLRKTFDNSFDFLPVTYQTAEIATAFLSKNKLLKDLKLPSVASDSSLHQLFPHKLIPHYVWISPVGKVIAITGEEAITREHITDLLNGKKLRLSEKIDIPADKPLFLSNNLAEDRLQHYSVLIKGFHAGIGSGITLHKKGDTVYGQRITNYSLYRMYECVASSIFKAQGERFSSARCIVAAEDPVMFSLITPITERDRLYSFELIVPLTEAASVNSIMLESLNRYTDGIGTMEKRRVKCLIIKRARGRISGRHVAIRAGASQLSLAALIKRWDWENRNRCYPEALPLLDESGFNGSLAREVTRSAADKASLRKALEPYGLTLVESARIMNMLVLKSKVH